MPSKKLGREPVRSVSDPQDGVLLSDQHAAIAPNVWLSPGGTTGGTVPVDKPVEGVVIKALAANTGTIYITEIGKNGVASGFPLAKSESISIGTDNLDKVRIFVPTLADGFAYLAIEQVIK